MNEEIITKGTKQTPTLCWNCAKATGYCRWSSELKPVKGWKIVPTKRENSYGVFRSCIVLECPEFVQDSYKNGLIRKGEHELYDSVSENS